jgi:hypothetical protein
MSAASVDDALTYVFTWRTSHDERVCPICAPLDGQVIFYNLFAPILVSDTHGPVWDLDGDHSLAHGVRTFNCRCTLDVDVDVDWGKIREFQELRENLAKQDINIEWVKERFKLSSQISEARNQMERFYSGVTRLKTATHETNRELTIYLALGRRIGDERITRLITLFQQGRITAEMLIRALTTLTAASGPWGWALGLGQAALAGLMISDIIIREDVGSEGPQ